VTGWTLVVTGPARSDIGDILRWTRAHFGSAQAAIYDDKIAEALAKLRQGPDVPGSAALDTVAPAMGRLALRAPARHVVVYRAGEGRRLFILRLLHPAMDLPRHHPRE